MWRVFKIVKNKSEPLKSLQLDALGVDYYEIKFYNTVSKNTEVLCIDCVIAGNYICKVNDKKREFELNHQVIEFISNRYNLNTVAYQHFLVVESLSFLGVEEKLKLIKPFESYKVYRYGTEVGSTTLEEIFLQYYRTFGLIEDGILRILGAQFELLCSEDKFELAWTKYLIKKGGAHVK